MTTIIDLCKKTKWKQVKKAHKYLYRDDKNNYKKLFKRFQSEENLTNADTQAFELEVLAIHKDAFPKDLHNLIDEYDLYYSVGTRNINDPEAVPYSISFIPWSEVASYNIAIDTLRHHLPAEIIAHFLWEITFYGTEEEMTQQGNKLQDLLGECKEDNG